MPRCRKRSIFVISPFLIILFVLCFELHYWAMQPSNKVKWPTNPCPHKVVTDTITALKYSHTFIVSSYQDNREQNLTRVIAIVNYKKVQDLYCWFCCSHNRRISIIRAAVDIHSERFELPFGSADIVCLEPQNCSPNYVSVHSSSKGNIEELPQFEIRNRVHSTQFSAEFTVCLSVMVENHSNVLQFLQSMEMYKILGAQKVVIYMSSYNQSVEEFLKFYVAEGTVEIIPWPITSYIKFSSFWSSSPQWHNGKTTVLNDCIYRNMYRSRYVVLNDIDEIILPTKHLNWKTMMNSLENQNPETGIYFFESHFFPQSVLSSIDRFNVPLWKTVPGVNILQHIYKVPNRIWLNNPRKMIVNPRKVIQTSIHSVLKGYGRTMEVPKDIAILYTCRAHNRKDISDGYLIRDPAIWRFNASLISNVNEMLTKKMFYKSFKFTWKTLIKTIASILK
uniref:Glycosyltransferase family 92 protein n=1 Tax=Pogona vitticeps TaxID=103695 RepID=A0ABM5F7A6_9SAUR